MDYLAQPYVEEYLKEIRYTVDVIHGKARIPYRKYRAYGIYAVDVSPYLLGYLVGRELEPQEVLSTNRRNSGYRFEGRYLKTTENASPSESWLALNCNYVLEYEEEKYKCQYPVAIVSWPTLDVINHETEWDYESKKKEFNDLVTIDIRNFETGPAMKAGFFGAYHIYPNYPDFMNDEPSYNQYHDEEGRLRYGGYLREFMKVHQKFPALVAEFGLATGMSFSHYSPDGYHHGGLTEKTQGEGIVRMMKAIRNEGYAGGVIFEWMDEWAKKTWNTEPYIIPFERNVFWHNAIDPEQNYGILAVESNKLNVNKYQVKQNSRLNRLNVSCDATYLYIDIDFKDLPDFAKERLLIGIDTYDRNRGEFLYAPNLNIKAPSGMEFLLDFGSELESKLLVIPSYNIANYNTISKKSNQGIFEEINILTNKYRKTPSGREIQAVYFNASMLRYGPFKNNSYYHWVIQKNRLKIRIPWGRLNFTDPSSLRVLNDSRRIYNPSRDQFETVETEGIVVTAVLCDRDKKIVKESFAQDGKTVKRPFLWKRWENNINKRTFRWRHWEIPPYKERFKESYYIIQKYFTELKKEDLKDLIR